MWMALKCGWWCPLACRASIYLIEWNFFLSLSLSRSPLPVDLRLTRCTAATERVAGAGGKSPTTPPPAIPAMAAVETTILPEGGSSLGTRNDATSEDALREKMGWSRLNDMVSKSGFKEIKGRYMYMCRKMENERQRHTNTHTYQHRKIDTHGILNAQSRTKMN